MNFSPLFLTYISALTFVMVIKLRLVMFMSDFFWGGGGRAVGGWMERMGRGVCGRGGGGNGSEGVLHIFAVYRSMFTDSIVDFKAFLRHYEV